MLRAIILAVYFPVLWTKPPNLDPQSPHLPDLAVAGLGDIVLTDDAAPFLNLMQDGDATNESEKKEEDKAANEAQTDAGKNAENKTNQDAGKDAEKKPEEDAGADAEKKPEDAGADAEKKPEEDAGTDSEKKPDQDDEKKPENEPENQPENPPENPGGEDECAAKVSFKVQVTVLGKLGDEKLSQEEQKKKKDEASKWIFTTLLRSMMRDQQYKLSEKEVPAITVDTKEPFAATEDGQRSPLERTIIQFDFPDTDVCSAAAFGRFLCRDYDSAEEELLTGMLRSLDMAAQYPHAALQMASKAGLGPKTLITLRAAYVDGDSISSSCNWGTKFSSNSIQGALMMPDCPDHSVRCEEREGLCAVPRSNCWDHRWTSGTGMWIS